MLGHTGDGNRNGVRGKEEEIPGITSLDHSNVDEASDDNSAIQQQKLSAMYDQRWRLLLAPDPPPYYCKSDNGGEGSGGEQVLWKKHHQEQQLKNEKNVVSFIDPSPAPPPSYSSHNLKHRQHPRSLWLAAATITALLMATMMLLVILRDDPIPRKHSLEGPPQQSPPSIPVESAPTTKDQLAPPPEVHPPPLNVVRVSGSYQAPLPPPPPSPILRPKTIASPSPETVPPENIDGNGPCPIAEDPAPLHPSPVDQVINETPASPEKIDHQIPYERDKGTPGPNRSKPLDDLQLISSSSSS
jgi:hypothetical protein